MLLKEIIPAIMVAKIDAKRKHPYWPEQIPSQAGIISAKAGKIQAAALKFKYNRANTSKAIAAQREDMRMAALQCAAACIEFIENLSD